MLQVIVINDDNDKLYYGRGSWVDELKFAEMVLLFYGKYLVYGIIFTTYFIRLVK